MSAQNPQIAVFFLHPGCNMVCTFCVTENAFSAMRFHQAVRLLDFVKGRGVDTVVLGGGEPFTWRHSLLALTREAKARRLFVQVGTNGTLLPDDFERIESIDRYVLPLDAADEAAHNHLRRFKNGHHGLILDRLQKLRVAGKSVTISTVVTAQNIHTLPAVADFLDAYWRSGGQLHAWHLYKFIAQGRGGRKNASSLDVSEDEYHAACADVKRRDLGFQVYKRKDMFHSKTVDFFWYQGDTIQIGSEVWSHNVAGGIPISGHLLPAVANALDS